MPDIEPVKKKAKNVEKGVRATHPIRRLLLLDVLSDKDSRLVFYWVVVFLIVGTLVYHWLEGWSFIDSLYFSVISLATVGYGDLSPTTPASKLFTVFYIINGIVILLAMFDRIRVVRMADETQRQEESSRDN